MGEYIIYYRQGRGAIVITRVLHGKRQARLKPRGKLKLAPP